MAESTAIKVQPWQPAFRHSSGSLGTHFLRALRDERRLLGWKTGRLGVTVPPIGSGEGEWVEIGPGATLAAFADPADLAPQDRREGLVCAVVRVDGADTPLFATVSTDNPARLRIGIRLVAEFVGAPEVPTFRPAPVTA